MTIPLFLISFFLAFNYYILRTLKDTLLITAEGSGAEAIPFVKVWLLLPASIIFAGGFSWLTMRFSLRTVFTVTLVFFLASYFCFTFLLFPYRESLHLHAFGNHLSLIFPPGWKGFAAVIRYWSFSFFYVMAECWGAIVYSVLFWGFANEVTKISDAEKSYPLLTLAGTIAALAAGPIAVHCSLNHYNPLFPFGDTPWEQSMYSLTLLVLISGAAALIVFHTLFPTEILTEHSFKKSAKPKLSLWKSFVYLAQSKYLLMIALVTFSFNMMMNMTEVFWKDQLLKLYPSPGEMNSYMSSVNIVMGIISTGLTLTVCGPLLRNFGWTFTAIITPFIAMVTGICFFIAIYTEWISLSGVVFLGAAHVCLSFSGKYTLLDMTKELAFIPLDSDHKLKGKAAIDGVGSRVGKASSSILFQCLLAILPSITACIPYVSILLLLSMVICILSIQAVGKQLDLRASVGPHFSQNLG